MGAEFGKLFSLTLMNVMSSVLLCNVENVVVDFFSKNINNLSR